MTENLLFHILFIFQVYFFSYHFPKKMYGRMEYVFTNYSAEEYPKLYPKSMDHYKKSAWFYYLANMIILVIGIVLVGFVIFWDYRTQGDVSEMVPWLLFMIQFIPMMILELSGFSYAKQMRSLDKRKARSAELRQRRVFNYIAPIKVYVSILSFIAMAYYQLTYNAGDEILFLGIDSKSAFVIGIILLTYGFFGWVIYYNLHGKKMNPYLADNDRDKQIEATIKSIVYVSIGMNLFIILNNFVNNTAYEFLKPSVMSIYLQAIGFASLTSMLNSVKLEEIDFEVYRVD